MDSYWGFLVGRTTAKSLIGPEGSWEQAMRFLGLLPNRRSKLISNENGRDEIG